MFVKQEISFTKIVCVCMYERERQTDRQIDKENPLRREMIKLSFYAFKHIWGFSGINYLHCLIFLVIEKIDRRLSVSILRWGYHTVFPFCPGTTMLRF